MLHLDKIINKNKNKQNKVFCDQGFYKRLAKGVGKVFTIRKNYKLKGKKK